MYRLHGAGDPWALVGIVASCDFFFLISNCFSKFQLLGSRAQARH